MISDLVCHHRVSLHYLLHVHDYLDAVCSICRLAQKFGSIDNYIDITTNAQKLAALDFLTLIFTAFGRRYYQE